MKLSRASGYAVLSVLAIARQQRQDPGGSVQIKEIAAEHDLPHDYIAKLLTMLVKARILNSGRGRDGGFTLRRRASEISVLDIVEAVDGPVETTDMLTATNGNDEFREHVGGMFDRAMAKLREVLQERTIERLLPQELSNSEV